MAKVTIVSSTPSAGLCSIPNSALLRCGILKGHGPGSIKISPLQSGAHHRDTLQIARLTDKQPRTVVFQHKMNRLYTM